MFNCKNLCILIIINLYSLACYSQTTDQPCTKFKKFEKETNKDLPRKIDEYTNLISVSVNCDSKIIKYTKQVLAHPNQIQKGFKKRKQRQHNQLNCNKTGLSSTFKWTVIDIVHDKDFRYLTTLATTPKDCD